jgi:hypothetical protein
LEVGDLEPANGLTVLLLHDDIDDDELGASLQDSGRWGRSLSKASAGKQSESEDCMPLNHMAPAAGS